MLKLKIPLGQESAGIHHQDLEFTLQDIEN